MALDSKYMRGLDDANRVLKQLPNRIENKVLQAATRKGAGVLAVQLRKNAPRGTGKQSPASQTYGKLIRNIRVQALKSKRRKGQRGSQVWTRDAFWGYILEFGSKYISARPWWRPTVAANEQAAFAAMREELGKGIEREAEKLSRSRGR